MKKLISIHINVRKQPQSCTARLVKKPHEEPQSQADDALQGVSGRNSRKCSQRCTNSRLEEEGIHMEDKEYNRRAGRYLPETKHGQLSMGRTSETQNRGRGDQM